MAKLSNKTILEALAAKYKCKPANIQSRMIYLGMVAVCSRCGGTGKYSFNQIDGDRCYGCGGLGEMLKKLDSVDIETFNNRVSNGELNSYFARNAAIAWCKASSKEIFDVWGNSNVGKAYSGAWHGSINLAPEIYRRNNEMYQLQEEAHKIIHAYQYGEIDTSNAVSDKAKLADIINKIKALDLSLDQVNAMMIPVLEAQEKNRAEMKRLREERLNKLNKE